LDDKTVMKKQALNRKHSQFFKVDFEGQLSQAICHDTWLYQTDLAETAAAATH